jgi:hypothetical protein
MYTEEDQPGVEQRFSLPALPLQIRVSGQAEVVVPVVASPSEPESSPSEPALPEAPTSVSPSPNTPPRIAALASLAVAVGGESYGPLLASFLSDAEDPVEALQVEVAGDGQVAARVEGGRLVVRGLRAGSGQVEIRVADSQGVWASAQVKVEVRAAGQGPRLRALPKMVLSVGGEKVLDLAAYVYDPDTPLAALSWTLVSEGGVEAHMAGTLLSLRGASAGPARLSLQVADPEGNVAMAALAVQIEAAATPADSSRRSCSGTARSSTATTSSSSPSTPSTTTATPTTSW